MTAINTAIVSFGVVVEFDRRVACSCREAFRLQGDPAGRGGSRTNDGTCTHEAPRRIKTQQSGVRVPRYAVLALPKGPHYCEPLCKLRSAIWGEHGRRLPDRASESSILLEEQ